MDALTAGAHALLTDLAALTARVERLQDAASRAYRNSGVATDVGGVIYHLGLALRDMRSVTLALECEAAVAALPADANEDEYHTVCERFSSRRGA